MGREAVVLTLVATGRSAGVGVVWWCGSPARRKKRKAAARRRGSRGSRGSRCPGDGGSSSSHGRLRSSRRTAPSTGGSTPPSPPFTPFSSGGSTGGHGSNSPRRLGLGSPPRLGGGLNSGARRGTRGRLGCAGRRGARRDDEARGRRARLWLWSSAKATKVGDDVVTSSRGRVTRCGLHLPATRVTRGRWRRRGWSLGRGWAGSSVGLKKGLAAR
jgi:hypothetical protein